MGFLGAGGRAAAFFDLDRTVVSCNTGRLFVHDLRRRREVSLVRAVRAMGWLLRYYLGVIDVHVVADAAASSLEGLSEPAFRDRCRRWVAETIFPRLLPDARRRIEDHRQDGHYLVLLTTTPEYMAEPVATALGFDEVVSTRLEVVDGRFTGKVVVPACFGSGKVHWAEKLVARERLDLQRSWFYTDSFSDLPMLEKVGHRVVVNPDPRLRRTAKRRGWTVETWMEAAA